MNFHSPIRMLTDSLRNFVTGLGTYRDPTTSSHYHYHELNRHELEQVYRSNPFARCIIDAPSEDATREWRDWQANEDQIEAIEALEKDLMIQRKMLQALVRARLYGGAAMVIGVENSGEVWEELDLERVGEGDLKFVVVMNRYELSAGPRIYDVMSPYYTRPEYYTVSTPTEGVDMMNPGMQGMVRIHPSRVIEFCGNDLPDWRLQPLGGNWGDSVIQTVDEILKDFGLTIGGIANMVNDAKMDVIKIPGLSNTLADKDAAKNLVERFMYANMAKSSINALLLDENEDWDRITTTFSGLPDLIDKFMTLVSGASRIPVTRFFGSSPGKGLAASGGGESDLHNYYDDIMSKQKTVYGPAMRVLDGCIVRSALGSNDPNIYYDWAPLYKPDPKAVADIAFTKAQATNLDVQMGLINEDALRAARINQLQEDGTYPGLDDAIEEFGEEPEVDPMEQNMQQAQLEQMQAQTKQIAAPANGGE